MNFKGTSKYQKFSELMKKKTHFTETEIDRLTDLHKTTMVEVNVSRLKTSISLFRKVTTTEEKWIEKCSESFFMTSWT